MSLHSHPHPHTPCRKLSARMNVAPRDKHASPNANDHVDDLGGSVEGAGTAPSRCQRAKAGQVKPGQLQPPTLQRPSLLPGSRGQLWQRSLSSHRRGNHRAQVLTRPGRPRFPQVEKREHAAIFLFALETRMPAIRVPLCASDGKHAPALGAPWLVAFGSPVCQL